MAVQTIEQIQTLTTLSWKVYKNVFYKAFFGTFDGEDQKTPV